MDNVQNNIGKINSSCNRSFESHETLSSVGWNYHAQDLIVSVELTWLVGRTCASSRQSDNKVCCRNLCEEGEIAGVLDWAAHSSYGDKSLVTGGQTLLYARSRGDPGSALPHFALSTDLR